MNRMSDTHSVDIKPDNILVDIPDLDEAVRNHLIKSEQSNRSQQEDSSLTSRPIVNNPVSESSIINIRITDFGVGMSDENFNFLFFLLQNTLLIHHL
jgi:serine/threonine protein kinase